MLQAEGLTPAETGRREKGKFWNKEQFGVARIMQENFCSQKA